MNQTPHTYEISRRRLWIVTILLALLVSVAVSAGGAILGESEADEVPAAVAAESEAAGEGEAAADDAEAEEAEAEGGEAAEEEEEAGLAITSIAFHPNRIRVTVENGGDEKASIGIVMVDEAVGPFTLEGSRTLKPGEERELNVSYQWVEGDPYEFGVVDDHGGIAEAETVAEEGEAELEGGEEEEE